MHPADDTAAADWLVERLTTFAESVLSLVPDGFEAYVRVRHPYREGTQPLVGALEPEHVAAIAGVLGRHTGTPRKCFFAIWDGYGGGYPFDTGSAPSFELPGRRYYLLTGTIEDARRGANIWWPGDHAWCVATEIDLYSTYVGCSAQTGAELGTLGGDRIPPETGITFADDPYGV